ncbi:hypothetical protein JHK82_046584 [Glycine max]|nr:hypothetical protein JHK82_046584 [Glycine max]KAG5101523.1 hypothetical protein JHK84_046492 [Glycine max]
MEGPFPSFRTSDEPISKHLFFLDVGAVRVVRVRRNGAGDFTTVTDAVNSIPSGNKRRVVVWIGMGEYRENVTVDRSKPFVTFYGERNGTDNDNDRDIMPIITYDATALRYGTVDSATVAVDADYFVAVNLASSHKILPPVKAFTNSFAGELLKAGIISNPDNNEVIWRITTNLSSIVSTLPANCKAIGCTHGAGSHSQGSMNFGDYIRAASDEQIYVFVALRCILDSPLNKAGMVGAIYVKIDQGGMFEVKPHVQLPQTCSRFCGVISLSSTSEKSVDIEEYVSLWSNDLSLVFVAYGLNGTGTAQNGI